jgi:hypothetical protein
MKFVTGGLSVGSAIGKYDLSHCNGIAVEILLSVILKKFKAGHLDLRVFRDVPILLIRTDWLVCAFKHESSDPL